jgi:pyrroloquinoline quinone (PQQ) biosynthesis protein C
VAETLGLDLENVEDQELISVLVNVAVVAYTFKLDPAEVADSHPVDYAIRLAAHRVIVADQRAQRRGGSTDGNDG